VLSLAGQIQFSPQFIFPERPEVRRTKGLLSKHLFGNSGIKETVSQKNPARLAEFLTTDAAKTPR
jgi:hypothetical protein